MKSIAEKLKYIRTNNNMNVTEKLRKIAGEQDFSFRDLFSSKKRFVHLHIRAEDIDFSRAQVFIDDVNAKTKGAFYEFTVEHIILMLYMDFLHQIREYMNEVRISDDTVTQEDVARHLLEKRKIYFPRRKQSEKGNYTIERKNWALFEIQLRQEAVRRGNVFLYDVNKNYPEFNMSIEELISILFCDFVAQLYRGNQQSLINVLLDRFYSHDFD